MRPNYGTSIYDLIMNPLDDYVEQGSKRRSAPYPFERS